MRVLPAIIVRLIQNRICRHILFWAFSYYYLLHFFLISRTIETIDYIYTGVFHLPLLAAVYTNLGILIPRFLRAQKYFYYAALVLLLLAASVACNKLIFDHLIDYLAPNYFFVSDLNTWEILQFSSVYLGLTSLIRLSRAWFSLQESRSRLVYLEKEKINSELSFLRSQLNPHFLFNSLNNIYSLVLKKDATAPASLLKLSSVMRYMIYESDGARVPLKKEIEYISDYVELQRLRVRTPPVIGFDIEGEIVDQTIAPLIFIVFIENAFKHGVGTGSHPTNVEIRLKVQRDRLRLIVVNGKGLLDEVAHADPKGLGIGNVKKRLDLIYPGHYDLRIDDGRDKYMITLDLVLTDT